MLGEITGVRLAPDRRVGSSSVPRSDSWISLDNVISRMIDLKGIGTLKLIQLLSCFVSVEAMSGSHSFVHRLEQRSWPGRGKLA